MYTYDTRGIANEAQNANEAGINSSLSQGIDQSRGLLNDSGSYERSLGFDPMSAAIKQRYSQEYGRGMARLENEKKMASKELLFKKLETASRLANEEVALNHQRQIIAEKQRQAKRARRGMVIGQVLGLAGAAVGAAVGGPGGAMMGYSAGSAAGGAASA